MRKITKIEPTVPSIKQRKKVAAYARVSMQSERMLHSFSAQISYYSSLIQKNPDWEYVGVYADDFISGTNKVRREEFQRMLADCEKGKIDIILTKSISRFARNTVDLLETVRHLKSLGIEVRFEKENINSMSGDGELMLSILASFAQEESRSISDNVKWGIRKRMQNGMITASGHFTVYGYRWEGDELVIVPEEAKIVKRIFQNFLDGKSRLETEREFAAEGITTRQGCRWVDSNIRKVLENITYTGNMLFQKEFISDPISKQRKKNRGELPKYYLENTHEPIIDKAVFDYVQAEMARRRELGALANKSLNITCFTGKIKCEHCGISFMRNIRNNRSKMSERGDKVVSWVCGSKKKKGCRCPTREIPDHILKRICAEVLGTDEFDEDVFTVQIDRITVPEHGTLVFYFKDGSTIPATLNRFTAVPVNSKKKRRVAGYARVSTDHEEQLTSYEAQVDYYTNYIKSRSDWEFAGIYTDEGISATNTKRREGFKSMIADAKAGKIDLIVTKSVSRFARNTVDSLTTVRELKEMGIEIYFEKENIWTLDSKGELLITIMSSLAQEESRSISENVTWGQRKRFADGKVSFAYSHVLGFDKGADGQIVVNKEQAETTEINFL